MTSDLRRITTDTQGDVLVIRVTEPRLREYELVREMETEMVSTVRDIQAQKVVLDFSMVEMMTSAALLPLLGLRSYVKERGGQVVVCNLSEPVAQTLVVSQLVVERRNLSGQFRLASDVESAIESFRQAD